MKIEDKDKPKLFKKKKPNNLLFGDETQEERKRKNKKYRDNLLIEKNIDKSKT